MVKIIRIFALGLHKSPEQKTLHKKLRTQAHMHNLVLGAMLSTGGVGCTFSEKILHTLILIKFVPLMRIKLVVRIYVCSSPPAMYRRKLSGDALLGALLRSCYPVPVPRIFQRFLREAKVN